MNFMNIFGGSNLGRQFFKDDLSEKAKPRKALVDKIAALKKELAGLSTKPVKDVDAEIKKAETKLNELREKRGELLAVDHQNREALLKQIKMAETELKSQTPVIVANCRRALYDRVKSKTLLTNDESRLAKALFDELTGLTNCLDDAAILKSVADIENRAAAGL
ncbi:hypothetical protein [Methylomonas sp. MgM2]